MALPAGLYDIADASFGDPAVIGMKLFDAGCAVVQLRAKSCHEEDIERWAKTLMKHIRETNALLIINDHIDIAIKVGAHGVHLGQTDGCTIAARKRLPPNTLIGKSTHTLTQVKQVTEADYIGFGPVFTTQTKRHAGNSVGCLQLKDAVQASAVPVVAIGGITRFNLNEVRSTGVHGWAIIRDLIGQESIPNAVQHLSF